MLTRLLIARHGNTFGPNDVVTRVGKTDLPLVESGLKQGYQLGVSLLQSGLSPDVVFSSELQRTLQTAKEAIKAMQLDLPIQPLAMFNEIDYGIDENQPEEQVVARLGREALNAWEKEAIVPEGWQVCPETIIKNWQMFARDLQKEFSGKTILVVTSNGIARFAPHLTGDFTAFSAKHAIKMATGAFSVFENEAQAQVWQCVQWNVKVF